jgi:hypothetical protein
LPYNGGRTNPLGVLHRAEILDPDDSERLIINSIMLAVGAPEETGQETLRAFVATEKNTPDHRLSEDPCSPIGSRINSWDGSTRSLCLITISRIDGRSGDDVRDPLQVSASLARQQPEEAQPADLGQPEQDSGGDVPPRLVIAPGAGG